MNNILDTIYPCCYFYKFKSLSLIFIWGISTWHFTNISPHLIGSYIYVYFRLILYTEWLTGCYLCYLIPIICCGIVPACRCVGYDFKWHFINYGDVIFTHVHVISGYLFKFELSEGFSGYLLKFELSELIFGYLSSNFLRETVKNNVSIQ